MFTVYGRIISDDVARIAFGAICSDVRRHTGLPGGHSEREPPDPIPNSEVKTFSADGSVEPFHARVGHRQVFAREPR